MSARLLPVLFLVSACHVQLVAPYDDAFDTQVTTAQHDLDALMQGIAADPARSYDSLKADYLKVRIELDGLAVRAGSHANNDATVRSVNTVRKTFETFAAGHMAKQEMHPQFVLDQLATMNIEFTVLLREELAKKAAS